MKVSIIAAISENGVIGKDNGIPWRLKKDLKRFKELTMGKPVIMGRKTFESIGKALPGRTNVVVSRVKEYPAENCLVVKSVKKAFELLKNYEEVFVIGGAKIYTQTIPLADVMYITRVHAHVDGDTYFPETQWIKWEIIESECHSKDEENEFDFSFQRYHKFDLSCLP